LEKELASLRTYTTPKDSRKHKNRFCITCGNIATTEALFNVGEGVIIIEKYCDICAKQVR
jgi:ribosomal protein L33